MMAGDNYRHWPKTSMAKAPVCRTTLTYIPAIPVPGQPTLRTQVTDFKLLEYMSRIHRQFRNAHESHRSHAGLDPTLATPGAAWCTEQAHEYGLEEEPEYWADLGQAFAEVNDDIEGCHHRQMQIDITMAGRQYGPVEGITSLRIAVARLYNTQHRYVAWWRENMKILGCRVAIVDILQTGQGEPI
jgi:hypothetical protein